MGYITKYLFWFNEENALFPPSGRECTRANDFTLHCWVIDLLWPLKNWSMRKEIICWSHTDCSLHFIWHCGHLFQSCILFSKLPLPNSSTGGYYSHKIELNSWPREGRWIWGNHRLIKATRLQFLCFCCSAVRLLN